ncbi:flagellar motor switch protein FliN [Zooshikella marina]|uniref:Flagellar motor switch protein FliN n=1 Tax=Zooshikella ganghwensis TaxID=202772 RepID=A0A4P9VJZ4_9GAMM|nr:flagellar motor switch protein FliN [Zooshikella ganghwensis]RDH43608.1 flagellar motor switch protein FliN [Zooshikella ganghwensis]
MADDPDNTEEQPETDVENTGEAEQEDSDTQATAMSEETPEADETVDQDDNGEESAGSDEQALADEWAAALAESEDKGSQEDIDELFQTTASPMDMDELEDIAEPTEIRSLEEGPNLDVILDIPVTISMEVGGTDITIRNLLQLNQGSVIELDRLAGEPLDVKVNGTLIAHGEVVVVNEKFGIRLTDVISPTERIKKLR